MSQIQYSFSGLGITSCVFDAVLRFYAVSNISERQTIDSQAAAKSLAPHEITIFSNFHLFYTQNSSRSHKLHLWATCANSRSSAKSLWRAKSPFCAISRNFFTTPFTTPYPTRHSRTQLTTMSSAALTFLCSKIASFFTLDPPTTYTLYTWW